MESELSPDKQNKEAPAVPLKTYQWEDLRRSREAGGYPWTHLLKAPLTDEITAEDIIRESTPRRSMSREFSRSRTHSPVDMESQKILNLDSSPGSSRKHNEEGQDEGIHIPNFSKEVSLDEEESNQSAFRPPSQTGSHLSVTMEIPKNVSPKGILKRRLPDQQFVAVTESREKTKCCHPLVNKIKHLADKTLHKLERSEGDKSPLPKHKKVEEVQEIRQLKSSPGAVRRKKFSAIKLGDSDEMSKTMSISESSPSRKKKEHIYEDIEDRSYEFSQEKPHLTFKQEDLKDEDDFISQKENGSVAEKKSNASQDPSLVTEETNSLSPDEHIMEKLHKLDNLNKDILILDDEMDTDEPNVDEIFQNQLDETILNPDSPNITITEIFDENSDPAVDQTTAVPIETSPSPSPMAMDRKLSEAELAASDWSKPNSDHEYEIIDKPKPHITYNEPRFIQKSDMSKTDDELSSTTSLERKFLQHTSDEDDQTEEKLNLGKGESLSDAEVLQKDIEDRYFVNTPSTVSRTECEVSTSQVDSSALENLPLKRGSRVKNAESIDSKIQQRIKEGTGKLKTQAGKLKTKLQNIKTKQFSMPERPKINLPERPKFSFPERPKFNLPDRRKFSLPDRPKFKKINISEKIHFKDRKFTLPERPRFNVPDFPKFKMPDRPKINFPSLGRKKEYKVGTNSSDSSPDLRNVASVEFETKTYPRIFNRKKKQELPKTSSSPTLNREDTPPATFTFTRVKKSKPESSSYVPDSTEQPREYGNIDVETKYEREFQDQKQFDNSYDFDKMNTEYLDEESPNYTIHQSSMTHNISTTNQENSHINEINNDEFFVRPRGISRENIQVREYLSDEIRQAFKIPQNVLAQMGSHSGIDDKNIYTNDLDADPELLEDDDEPIQYSTEDINDRDDGYYTFPPVRPSRAKRKKKEKEQESIQYIDDSVNASIHFSEVDLGLPDERDINEIVDENAIVSEENIMTKSILKPVHEYANDDILRYDDSVPIQSQTLPMPPKRKKQFTKKEFKHSSLNDFKEVSPSEMWNEPDNQIEDIIVYRTEHEYIIPAGEVTTITERSPVPPRRNRSQSSRGTSLCDDDRTSHGAESLTLDTHVLQPDVVDYKREIRQESPGYAQVQKGPIPDKGIRRSKSKTPPVRRRKSNSSERKYYTVGPTKPVAPDRPARKKSSTSLMTLDSFTKRSVSADLTQYDEINEPQVEESQKEKLLISGEVINKMKDRPLPPPPRPPRLPKKTKKRKDFLREPQVEATVAVQETRMGYLQQQSDVVEIEVSTQTDPLPDDVDFELGVDENFDVSMSSSLHDIVDEDSIISRERSKLTESPHVSRPTSRMEKSLKLSDPKISELSKPVGRTSPTVILVERRVSSPTRINEREEMLTEASLTVQHIDIDESQIPDVPPLPKSRGFTKTKPSKTIDTVNDEQALDRVTDNSRDVVLDNLITQRLQVRDLDVGRLNVSELQASKILVSDIEGMSLQVTELDSKSGHVTVSGIEFSQSVIDEIVKKFAEITTTQTPQLHHVIDYQRPANREEETQTELTKEKDIVMKESTAQTSATPDYEPGDTATPPSPPPRGSNADTAAASPPQRPPPPDLTPLLYSYLQDISLSPSSFYTPSLRERAHTEFHEPPQAPPPATRRVKRKRAAPHSSDSSSSSDQERSRPSPRRVPPFKSHEPSITEAGAQFFRVCQHSITRTLRHVFNSFMSYISGTEDKKDMQMALVIFLVLIAGLIMFGLSDSRTIHHHHWEFFNPPDTKK